MVGYSNKNTENFPESAFNQQKKKSRLKFNPGEVGTKLLVLEQLGLV